MSTNRDFERIAAAWLAEGPAELNDRVLDAALDDVHLTHQRHRRAAPWRTPRMSTPLRLAAGIAVIAVIGVAGLAFFGRGAEIGASPTASPSPTAVASSTPSPLAVDSPPQFQPPIRLTLVDGWIVDTTPSEGTGIVDLQRGQIDAGVMSIATMTVRGPTAGDPMVPWPDDIYAWLAGRPEFRPSKPVDTTVGGRPATIIDSDVVVGPDTDTGDWLKFGAKGWNLRGSDGDRVRLVVVLTGAGSGIVALVGSRPADFVTATSSFDRLLATLKFR